MFLLLGRPWRRAILTEAFLCNENHCLVTHWLETDGVERWHCHVLIPQSIFPVIHPLMKDMRPGEHSSLVVIHQFFLDLFHALIQPVLLVIFHRHERPRIHVVNVNPAVQMVDLMLQNARIPPAGIDGFLLALFVQAFHPYAMGTGHQSHQAVKAQTSLKEFNLVVVEQGDFRIDDHMKCNHGALAIGKLVFRPVSGVFGAVFNDRQLEIATDLRRGQSHARGVVHGLAHAGDQLADFTAADFVRPQRPRSLAKHWFTSLNNRKNQAASCKNVSFYLTGQQYPASAKRQKPNQKATMKGVSSPFTIRLATPADVPVLRELIDASVRGLQAQDYTPSQLDSALRTVYGVDSQLIADGTYFAVECASPEAASLPTPLDAGQMIIVACGGWSKRKTLYGGDVWAGREDTLLDPRTDAAKIRAFFVHPAWSRRGIGGLILDACESAAIAAGFRRLEMGATLTGVPFYLAKGYVELEHIAVPLEHGETLPIVRMAKDVVRS
jgi:GNAT superfamily N-acetyltransferase